jgi:hypothetical protein
MPDQDKDLVHLFVRDLDEIELPPRDLWRPAPRKESHLMKTSRYVLYAGAVAAVLVLALLASFGLRDRNQVTTSPTSPATTPSPAASATTSPSASGSPTASPSSSGRYASAGLGYSIETPGLWHKSICSAAVITPQASGEVGEVFVPVSARDETSTDIGAAYTTLRIRVEANPRNLSPRQWAEQDRTISGPIEDVTYAGRPAVRNAVTGTSLFTYFVASGSYMYKIDPLVRPPLDAATEQTLVRMIDSFRFLTEAEQAAARAAVPTPLPARTPEQVADGVAAAMAAKNVDALAGFLSPCVSTFGENAGGTTVSRERYVDDLRASFAAGLVVTVRPRPFDGDPATGHVTIASTWQDARGTKERKLTLMRGENDRWAWTGTIERF